MQKTRNPELWEFESEMPSITDDLGVILGVDGGATSTVCVCIAVPDHGAFHEPPAILSRSETSGSNHNSVGDAAARFAVEKALAEAMMKSHRRRTAVRAVCLGMSGVDSPYDQQLIFQWLQEIFPHGVALSVYNDSAAALASGTLGKLHGCVLVAGTGSIAFGVSEFGEEARAAGAGALLGDEGSGYFIGQQALISVIRAHDGRGPATILTKTVLDKLELNSPEDIVRWVYQDPSWHRMASIVPMVKACAAAGDGEARRVLNLAVEGLFSSVEAVVKRLNIAGEDCTKCFPLVMVGGVLESDNGWDVCAELVHRIMQIFPGVQPIRPKVEPALGAAMLGWSSYCNSFKCSIDCNGSDADGLHQL